MDLVHEVWEGAFGVAFMEQVDAGCVIDAATHDAKTREDWWYPSYVEDVCPGLPDWEALNDCASLFATPDSGGKGRFLGGPVDWLKGDQERVEGLEMDFIVENAGTAGALWAALDAASANQEPVVIFNWTPNFVEAMYDGKFIEFPEFADECRTDASWGLNPETTHDCGNPKDGYLKLGVWSGFPDKWPNAYAAVQKMNFTNLDIAQLAMYVDIDGMEPEDAAALWLADNCARWTGWASADASVCPEAPAGPVAGEGGTVTILYWQAASTLNPYLSGGWKDRDAGSVILEPLAEFDDQGVLVPALAVEIPTVSNGGVSADLTQITWTLLEGVLFSDGTPVTSDDVVFSWEYCSNPDTGCSGAGGFDGVTSVEAVDDLTVTITFADATPFPYVPFVSNSYPIIQRAQFGDCVGAASAECTDENFAPIGTGPFKIESFTTNDTAVYVINEHFRGVADGKPHFGRVVIKGGGDAPATARSVLELGEADYAWNLQVEPEILAGMLAGGKGKVISAFSTMVERIMVNQTNPDPSLGDDRSEYLDGTNPHPFLTDPVVGRALSIAIDRQTLVDVGYGEAGRPTCNVWPAPPAQTSTAQDECLTQDIDLANQLLDDAGYADTDGDGVRESPDGVPLRILYQTSTNTVRQATQELIKQDWAKIGVETELRNIDASVFFGGDPASPDTYGKFYADVEMYTNGAAGVDSQAYMGGWTTSNISGKDTTWQGSNVQRFQSDEYDVLHAELTQTADIDRRNEITIALNDLVVGNYSIIPLIHRGSVSAHANSLTGVRLNPWDAELWNIGDWGRN